MSHKNPSDKSDCTNNIEDPETTEVYKEELDNQQEDSNLLLLEKQNLELKDAYLRLSAETDNYRKRIQQEKELFKKIALKELIEKLLPVIDNLERSVQAAENSDNVESLKTGIVLVLQQFEDVLKDVGMETINVTKGDEFDPQICEAVIMEDRDDVEHSMTVLDVFETGRKLGGQVIRTAKVKVAKKK